MLEGDDAVCVAMNGTPLCYGDKIFSVNGDFTIEYIFGRRNLFGPLHHEVTTLVEPHYFDSENQEYILCHHTTGNIFMCESHK